MLAQPLQEKLPAPATWRQATSITPIKRKNITSVEVEREGQHSLSLHESLT